MTPLDALLRLVLLPGAVCAGAALLGWAVARRSARARDAVVALGAAAAFVASAWAVEVRPDLPLARSQSAWWWVVWLVPAGALLAPLVDATRLPQALRAVVRAAAATLGFRLLLLAPYVPHALDDASAWQRAGVGGAAAAALWTLVDAGSARGARVALVAPVLVAVLVAAVVLLQWGASASMATAAGALLVSLAATAVLAWPSRRALWPGAVGAAAGVGLVGLLLGALSALNYGSTVRVPVATAALLAAAALAGVVRRPAVAIVLAVLLAGAAAWFAYDAAPAETATSTPW